MLAYTPAFSPKEGNELNNDQMTITEQVNEKEIGAITSVPYFTFIRYENLESCPRAISPSDKVIYYGNISKPLF